MDSFYLRSFQPEKMNTIGGRYHASHRVLQNVARLFRVGEACIVLFFLSWISLRFPFAVRMSGEYLRQLVSFLLSPIFVFLVGNAIIVTLLAKSGQFSAQNSSNPTAGVDFCKAIADSSEMSKKSPPENPTLPEEIEIVFEDKQMICEENAVAISPPQEEQDALAVDAAPDKSDDAKVYRRSQSENLKRECPPEMHRGVLRRSETEICRKIGADEEPETPYPEDELSNEEFQRTIEAFIAKQLKFQREELFSIISQN